MFSIIIPLYNKAHYIIRALESVKAQTFKEYEILVIDDGSSDEGPNLVLNHFGDSVTLISQSNQGVSAARNAGIAKAKFDYIAFLDADDCWHPEYLETIRQGIAYNPNSWIFGCSYSFNKDDLKSKQGNFESIENYFEKAIRNTLFFTSATVVRKAFFDQNQGFKTFLKRGEDLDVWFRVILQYGNPAYCHDRLVFYEQGDDKSATRRRFSVLESLSSAILLPEYAANEKAYSKEMGNQFSRFREKYVLFNIYPYFNDPINHTAIKQILSRIKGSYVLVYWFYMLPDFFIQWFLSFSFFRNQFRNYLKFCFRYVYK
jgi:glycosyltransferase involved in cell wall biosynthesis